MMRLITPWILTALSAGLAAGCAQDDMGGEASGFVLDGGGYSPAVDAGSKQEPDGCETDAECSEGYICFQSACLFQGVEGPTPDGGVEPPPEPEDDHFETMLFSPPAAGREHVFIASPTTDAIARIHGETLAIDTIEVGDEPTVALTVPGEDRAVVLNRGSDELTLVTDEGTQTWPLPHHFNALTLDPSGQYALCWFNLSEARSGEDASALQDMTVVDLESDTLHNVAVGFRPTQVSFTADGEQALVVTDDGLSVFEPAILDERSIAYNVPIALNLLDQSDRDVRVTPNGEWVISRKAGERGVTVVSRAAGVPRFVPLTTEPTDLELLPDGETAVVMLRGEERLVLLDLELAVDRDEAPEAFVREISFEGHALGSIAVGPEGNVAVLFTTLDQAQPEVALLDLESERIIYRPLRKGVRGVAIEGQGRSAFILHTKAPGAPDPAQGDAEFVAKSYGYSLLDLSTNFAKLRTTPGDIVGLTFAGPDEAFATISQPSSGISEVHHIDLVAFEVRAYALGAAPEVVGVLPAIDRAFVTQRHPTGRISFIRLGAGTDGGRLETVSGYTLNGRIQ